MTGQVLTEFLHGLSKYGLKNLYKNNPRGLEKREYLVIIRDVNAIESC